MIHFSGQTERTTRGKMPDTRFITPMRQIRLSLWHDKKSIGQVTVSLGPKTPIQRAVLARNILIKAIRGRRINDMRALAQFCQALRKKTQALNIAAGIAPRRQGLKRNNQGEAQPPAK